MTAEIVLVRPVLHAAQQRVVDGSRRFNVIQCGRRFGKTTLGVDLAIDCALDGKPVGWFAPTYKILADAWRELVAATADIAKPNQQDRRLEFVTNGVIECWSLDQPDAGRSRKYARVIIDEAGIVRELESAWNGAIRPTLADYQGDAWFFGTPKGHNYFHRLYAKGQQQETDWISWRFGTVENPQIASEEVEAAKADMPTSVFEQEFLGIPADDGGNPFGLDAIRACISETGLSTAAPDVWGVDLAKSQDWTWPIALDKDGTVCRSERWQGPWSTTLERLAAMLRTGRRALVDSTGVGDPIVEQLQRRVGGNVEGYHFSAPSKQRLMEGLAAAIHQQTIRYPDGPLVAELESFGYEYTASGVRYSAPDGLHDDGVCALALAVQARSAPMPRSRMLN